MISSMFPSTLSRWPTRSGHLDRFRTRRRSADVWFSAGSDRGPVADPHRPSTFVQSPLPIVRRTKRAGATRNIWQPSRNTRDPRWVAGAEAAYRLAISRPVLCSRSVPVVPNAHADAQHSQAKCPTPEDAPKAVHGTLLPHRCCCQAE